MEAEYPPNIITFRLQAAEVGGVGDTPNNFGVPLPGKNQGSDRAEVYAVVRIIETDPRPMVIYCDSKYVVDALNKMIQEESPQPRAVHYDLWERIRSEVLMMRDRVEIRKTKGHATELDVRRGRSSPQEKEGNDEADRLAQDGSLAWSPPRELLSKLQHYRKLIENLQRNMLEILEARNRSPILENALEHHRNCMSFARRTGRNQRRMV